MRLLLCGDMPHGAQRRNMRTSPGGNDDKPYRDSGDARCPRKQRRPIIVVGKLRAGVGSVHRRHSGRAGWRRPPCSCMSPSRCAPLVPFAVCKRNYESASGSRFALEGMLPAERCLRNQNPQCFSFVSNSPVGTGWVGWGRAPSNPLQIKMGWKEHVPNQPPK